MKNTLALVVALLALTAVSSEDGCLSFLAHIQFMEYVTCYRYPVEAHVVVTDDDYELTIFRIQAKNTTITSGKPVVLLWHGLLDSADNWVSNDEHIAPGFILANQGYDVWFGNSRGTKYSLGHRQFDYTNSQEFWDFSWMEMSEKDLPAAFEYIAERTGKKITYIGHSQGTAQMFAALANPNGKNPKIVNNLIKFAALAPVAYVNHQESPFFGFLANANTLVSIIKYMGKYGLFVPGWMSTEAGKLICLRWRWMCSTTIQMLADRDPNADNLDRMKVIGGHFPCPTSARNLVHWQQMVIGKGEFTMYDFGEEMNMKKYGQKTPPRYDPKLITEEIGMFTGTDDLLADPIDVAAWLNDMKNTRTQFYEYKMGHLTFLLGKELSYMNDLLEFIKE